MSCAGAAGGRRRELAHGERRGWGGTKNRTYVARQLPVHLNRLAAIRSHGCRLLDTTKTRARGVVFTRVAASASRQRVVLRRAS
jgi:hypothetical protein